jgi:hypothetical protein
VIAFVPETPFTLYDQVPSFASLKVKVPVPTGVTRTEAALNVPLLAGGPEVW